MKQIDYSIPKKLLNTAEKVNIKIVDWELRFNLLLEKYDQQSEAIAKERNDKKQLLLEIEKLRTENDTLKTPLHETEKRSLQKMLIGIAMDKYDFLPHSQHCKATGTGKHSIYYALQKAKKGLEVTDDTIRAHLNTAVEELDL